MRSVVLRVAAFLIAALAVAACGSQGAAPPANRVAPPTASQGGPTSFVTRARQVTAQWDQSEAARAWRSGLVLLDPAELTQTPLNAGFSGERQKDAFGSGHFQLAGTLPRRPLSGRGLASVPAWRFTVAGLGWPASEVAVAPHSLVVLPGYGPVPSAGRDTPGVTGLAAVSPGSRLLPPHAPV